MSFLVRVFIAYSLLTSLYSAAADVGQPSFDCRRASTSTEKTICGSKELATYDKEVAKLYVAVRKLGVPQLVERQKAWLSRRDLCERQANVAGCVRTLYRERTIALMRDWLERKQEGSGPLEPIESVETEKFHDGNIIYLIHEFQYVYGSIINKYWIGVFAGDILSNQKPICRHVATEDGEFEEGDEKCTSEHARMLFER